MFRGWVKAHPVKPESIPENSLSSHLHAKSPRSVKPFGPSFPPFPSFLRLFFCSASCRYCLVFVGGPSSAKPVMYLPESLSSVSKLKLWNFFFPSSKLTTNSKLNSLHIFIHSSKTRFEADFSHHPGSSTHSSKVKLVRYQQNPPNWGPGSRATGKRKRD